MALAYKEALKSGRKAGMAHCSDEQLLANLLESTAQLMLGAVSPQLMYEGAQRRGLSSSEVMRLIHTAPQEAVDLQWR